MELGSVRGILTKAYFLHYIKKAGTKVSEINRDVHTQPRWASVLHQSSIFFQTEKLIYKHKRIIHSDHLFLAKMATTGTPPFIQSPTKRIQQNFCLGSVLKNTVITDACSVSFVFRFSFFVSAERGGGCCFCERKNVSDKRCLEQSFSAKKTQSSTQNSLAIASTIAFSEKTQTWFAFSETFPFSRREEGEERSVFLPIESLFHVFFVYFQNRWICCELELVVPIFPRPSWRWCRSRLWTKEESNIREWTGNGWRNGSMVKWTRWT